MTFQTFLLLAASAAAALASPRLAGAQTSAEAKLVRDVAATVETEPVGDAGDAADDPAVWVDPRDPSRSVVIGTNKKRGLAVYDLDGKVLQTVDAGRLNNVDVRDGFRLGRRRVTIVAASNRTDDSIALFRYDSDRRELVDVAARKIRTVTAYGSCLYRSPRSGRLYYFVTSKSGVVEQYLLFGARGGKVDARRVRRFDVGGQVEGCVADDELGHLYVGEEDVGIWKLAAEPGERFRKRLVDRAAAAGARLVSDVEGLTIAYGARGRGYLIASSQGESAYAVYRREGRNAYVGTFRIVDGEAADGTSETDGVDVTTRGLGPAFPQGLFVAQDGADDEGTQNFKLVRWDHVVRAVEPRR